MAAGSAVLIVIITILCTCHREPRLAKPWNTLRARVLFTDVSSPLCSPTSGCLCRCRLRCGSLCQHLPDDSWVCSAVSGVSSLLAPCLPANTLSCSVLPGHLHAFYLEYVYFDRREQAREGRFTASHAPGIYSDRVQTGGGGYGTIAQST